MRFVRVVLVSALTAALVIAVSGPAAAYHGAQVDPDDLEDRVVLTGGLYVPHEQHTSNVIVVDGPVLIEGMVHGSLVVGSGDVRIEGVVTGDVVVLRGRARVASEAGVFGAVWSSDPPEVEPGAVVRGETGRWDARALVGEMRAMSSFGFWLLSSVSLLALGFLLIVLFPTLPPRLAYQFHGHRPVAVGAGLVIAALWPLVGLTATASVLAAPLGVAVLLALFLVYPIGYVVGAIIIGSVLRRRSDCGTWCFLTGWAVLRFVALFPGAWVVAGLAATTVGLGAIVVAVFVDRSVPRSLPVIRPA